MSRPVVKVALATACVTWLSGCGSYWYLASTDSPRGEQWKPYGGVELSLSIAKEGAKAAVQPNHSEQPPSLTDTLLVLPLSALGTVEAIYFLAVDAPLSIALDTLTLPIGFLDRLEKQAEEKKRREKKEEPEPEWMKKIPVPPDD